MKPLFIFSALLFFHPAVQSQNVVQFSGVVVDAATGRGIPYATIYDKTTDNGALSNNEGFFSFPVQEGDEVVFTSVGYKRKYVIIPQGNEDFKFTQYVQLARDSVELPMATIYPWPTPDQFKDAFLKLKIPDDDLARARQNLNPDLLRQLSAGMSPAGSINTAIVLQNYAASLYYHGQTPPMNLFNPIAWSSFFKALANGDFKRKKKDE